MTRLIAGLVDVSRWLPRGHGAEAQKLRKLADRLAQAAAGVGKVEEPFGLAEEMMMSNEFEDIVASCFREATQRAVADHLAQGRAVHGSIGGVAVTISPSKAA